MEINTTLGLAGLVALGIIVTVLAWLRRQPNGGRGSIITSRSFRTNTRFGDPLLFTGDAPGAALAAPAADCSAASDGGGSGGCD